MECPHCGAQIDLHGQFAYMRGVQAFQEGEEILGSLSYLRKAKKGMALSFRYSEREKEAFTLFSEAYTSLQEAFQYEIPEVQRVHSVDMMIHMARLFLPRNMISSLEASYWNSLMILQNARLEKQELKEKLSTQHGLIAKLWGWRWKNREKTLDQAMAELSQKIQRIENEMSLAHPQHVNSRT